MKLGVVSRCLIVGSLLWMAGGTFFIAKGIDDAALKQASQFFEECEKHFHGGCWDGREMVYKSHSADIQGGLWGFAAAEATFWLVLAWIALGIAYGAFRFIMAGRKSE